MTKWICRACEKESLFFLPDGRKVPHTCVVYSDGWDDEKPEFCPYYPDQINQFEELK